MRNESIIEETFASHGWLHSYVRRWTKNEKDAEDIIQDSYYQLVKALDIAENPIENISSWLYRSIKNLLINFSKKKKEYTSEEDLQIIADSYDGGQSNPEREYMRLMFWEGLNKALEELPKEQREAFVMTELEGKSVKEAAFQQHVSTNTFLSRKHYAIKHLRKRLEMFYREIIKDG